MKSCFTILFSSVKIIFNSDLQRWFQQYSIVNTVGLNLDFFFYVLLLSEGGFLFCSYFYSIPFPQLGFATIGL